MQTEQQKRTTKSAASNGRFGASGGAVSSDTEQVTSSFALVRALPIPPPAAKPPDVSGNAWTVRAKTDL